MCGLVGIASRYTNGLTNKEADMFTTMLFLDTLRGWDSTGVFSVNKSGNVDICKAAIDGPDFIKTEDYKGFMRDTVRDGVFVCGHNRAATRGTITDKNAHPFYVNDKIILMQNGTMYGDHKQHKDVEVDSEAIAHVLDEEPDIEKALQKINAAFALVWYNTATETLHLLRNDDRPLYISYFNDRGMVWASEKETILYAASRADIKLNQEPYLLKEHHLVQLKLGDNGKYDNTNKDVDTKYKGQGTFQYADSDMYVFRHLTQWRRREENKNNVVLLPNNPAPVADKPRVRVFGDILGTDPHLAQFLFEDMRSAAQACRDLKNDCNKDGRIVIEPLDFVAAEPGALPKNWYVYGVPLTAETYKDKPSALVHWYVANKTIEEMLDLTTKYFYSVDIKTQVINCLTHKNAVSAFFYGHNPDPLNVNQLVSPNTNH